MASWKGIGGKSWPSRLTDDTEYSIHSKLLLETMEFVFFTKSHLFNVQTLLWVKLNITMNTVIAQTSFMDCTSKNIFLAQYKCKI